MPAKFQKIKSDSVQMNSSPPPQKVDICKNLISQYGTLAPPVVGDFGDGTKSLLYGDSELKALIELKADYAETMVVSIKDKNEANKLSLMLMEMNVAPDAVSEGELIQELIDSGSYNQTGIAVLLNKSVSWVNKRASLVTRLDPAVRGMVSQGLLAPQIAQEIARMPQNTQYEFSSKIINGKMPKSTVERLVSAYNRSGNNDDIKTMILDDPDKAKGLLPEKSVPQKNGLRFTGEGHRQSKPGNNPTFGNVLDSLKDSLAMAAKAVYQVDPTTLMNYRNSLKQLCVDIDDIKKIVATRLESLSFPQGKTADVS